MPDNRDKIEKKLSKRELLQFRRKAMVKELALFDEHERTHTGTAVNRKITASGGYENLLDDAAKHTANADEIRECVLQVLLLSGMENLPITVACQRTAARYGLAHNQVASLKDEVLIYLDKVATEVRLESKRHTTIPG